MKKYQAQRGKLIGKSMQGALHIHRSALSTLNPDYFQLYSEKLNYIGDFKFDVVKLDLKKKEVAFVSSPDWNTKSEPSVGDRITVKEDNSVRTTKGNNLIYHHKWMFVQDSYSGFNVKESKEWSELWMNHPQVIKLKSDVNEKFNLKIGRAPYWEEKVLAIIKR